MKNLRCTGKLAHAHAVSGVNLTPRGEQLGRLQIVEEIEGAIELAESVDGILRQAAFAHLVEHAGKGGVFLTEYVMQADRVVDG